MSTWNTHQKLAGAITRMAHLEQRVRDTRRRRTPEERRVNSRARNAILRAYFDLQDAFRNI